MIAQYTSGSDKLHMAYTFDYLGGGCRAAHFRQAIDMTETKSSPRGGCAWRSPTTTSSGTSAAGLRPPTTRLSRAFAPSCC